MSAFADCKANPSEFKVCPADLPDIPDYKLLCRDGCFLFHPDDERAARLNKKRVSLIPDLEANIDELNILVVELTSQRDRSLSDVATFRGLSKQSLNTIGDLEAELADAHTMGDVLLFTFGGFAAGVVLTIGAVIAGAFLL